MKTLNKTQYVNWSIKSINSEILEVGWLMLLIIGLVPNLDLWILSKILNWPKPPLKIFNLFFNFVEIKLLLKSVSIEPLILEVTSIKGSLDIEIK